jgi:hypothetical protein
MDAGQGADLLGDSTGPSTVPTFATYVPLARSVATFREYLARVLTYGRPDARPAVLRV